MFYLGSCSVRVTEIFNVTAGTESVVVKTGVHWQSHRTNVGQPKPALPAQLVCLPNSSSPRLYGIVR